MQKFQLNTLGFDALQRVLYKHSDAELEHQSLLINQDFIQWMDNNFELNREQINHLKTLSGETISQLASQTAIAIQGRLPVTLIKPEIKPVIGYDSKLIEPKQLVMELATLDGKFEAEGELIIQISY
ncbi:hypothetical protein [Pedobacter sp. Leaf132]|uniref:hypothetical protein n=1 Tax=Pedobacter sp. Leaf132 TaxID=2876557 RepID=UPI001E617D81|nr:hypothetical protein [Pedobacter sp. Leaf132]